jgi:hypothetical protein
MDASASAIAPHTLAPDEKQKRRLPPTQMIPPGAEQSRAARDPFAPQENSSREVGIS